MLRSVAVGTVCVLVACNAAAVATPPCTDVPGMDIIPLSNGTATYCVSDYGWSDAWFVGSAPAIYDPRFDVLSGDDAPNLHWSTGGAPLEASGFGWISPVMDGGTLLPTMPTGSLWSVLTPVHFIAGSFSAQSLVTHPVGLQMLITTTLVPVGQQITQTFRITNATTGTTFDALRFADYFNFHPNGSFAPNQLKGTVSYDPLSGITITGLRDDTFIADGNMRGERVDDAHGRNGPFLALPIDVLDMVQTNVYLDPGPAISPGPGDVAGGLAWDLGALAPGESVEFSIFKLAEPLPRIPEPASLALVLPVLMWLWSRAGVAGRVAAIR
ncbi:MAG: hypothetical protein KF778_05010 [Rhodocyclaceae bacterium]|nr:hypothetical protein [Rhodocyclaceae bacterium]MBX3667743.1 hypothetical protein [Rhodocyclaceae bacterium]